MHGVVEGEGVEPESVDGATQASGFETCQRASGRAEFGAVPFLAWVKVGDLVGCAAYDEEPLEEGNGMWWCGAGDVHRLGGVVGYEPDGIAEGTELSFGSEVEDGEAVGGDQGAEVAAG